LQDDGTEQVYLRCLDRFVQEKEKEIEEICGENYEVYRNVRIISLHSSRIGTMTGLCIFGDDITLSTSRYGTLASTDRRARWADGRRRKSSNRQGTFSEAWDVLAQRLNPSTLQKRALLKQRKMAQNIDEAIETLQICLRVLDLVNRVREMIVEGKYFAALRVSQDNGSY
jgi:hypothetical protein